MQNYDIASILIKIASNNIDRFEMFEAFSIPDQQKTDLEITINCTDYINKPTGKMLLDTEVKWIKYDTPGLTAYTCNKESGDIIYLLEVNESWSSAKLTYLKQYPGDLYNIVRVFSSTLFRNCILFHKGIVIHASAITLNGKGIMFSAPSGTGKSTQANLWKTHMKAKVLNGDRAAVRVLDNVPYVFGTPWSGSSPDFLNSSAPLSAIILLEQAPENSIHNLTKNEAIQRLMPRCFLPYYDSRLMNMAVDNIGNIVDKTPVWLLKCKPDKEAVEMVYQCVK